MRVLSFICLNKDEVFIKIEKKNSVACVHERTIPTGRPPHSGEVSAKFSVQRVPCGQLDGSLRLYSLIITKSGFAKFYNE
jgi:hypothetical protein